MLQQKQAHITVYKVVLWHSLDFIVSEPTFMAFARLAAEVPVTFHATLPKHRFDKQIPILWFCHTY